jgi:hypothetical protein
MGCMVCMVILYTNFERYGCMGCILFYVAFLKECMGCIVILYANFERY